VTANARPSASRIRSVVQIPCTAGPPGITRL
jgi:hypothetical protein